ncbi:MAG TPA: hypothetical protein VNO32_15595 [Candidatus Acidoferrum sp.]|nr:hypothetical protein [Candidatus Acidoferrum sp.]
MNELLREALSLAEGDARWLDDAARYFEDHASQLSDGEKSKWELLAAVYRERAQVSRNVAGKVSQDLATDGSSASHAQND